jgi:hypothetical protein
MPNLDEFLNKNIQQKEYELERIPGMKACGTCDEDVNGATWDPIELVMSWTCSKGHNTIFKVN